MPKKLWYQDKCGMPVKGFNRKKYRESWERAFGNGGQSEQQGEGNEAGSGAGRASGDIRQVS